MPGNGPKLMFLIQQYVAYYTHRINFQVKKKGETHEDECTALLKQKGGGEGNLISCKGETEAWMHCMKQIT
jgi:hypothetical protein